MSKQSSRMSGQPDKLSRHTSVDSLGSQRDYRNTNSCISKNFISSSVYFNFLDFPPISLIIFQKIFEFSLSNSGIFSKTLFYFFFFQNAWFSYQNASSLLYYKTKTIDVNINSGTKICWKSKTIQFLDLWRHLLKTCITIIFFKPCITVD